MISNNNRHGFTLVEVLVTMVLIAILAISMLNSTPFFMNMVNQQHSQLIAYSLANAQLEDLKDIAINNFSDSGLDFISHGTTLTSVPAGYIVTYVVATGSDGAYYKTITVTCTNVAAKININVRGFVVQHGISS